MKRNKILALVCALGLTLSLAACGGAAAKSAPEPDAAPENISETVSVAPETADEEYVLPAASEVMTAAEDIQNYLNIGSYSRARLLELLVYDGFSEEDAAAALDNSGVDWNAQAVLQAQLQMELLPDTTYDELVDQLEYEKFTHEEAVYAADNYKAN